MALSAGGVCVLWLDVLLRRLAIPIILLSAIIFRYNLLSLVYLLLLIVSFCLPGPRLKSQKYSAVVFHAVILVFSGLAAIGQALFQISIATEPAPDPNIYFCSSSESTWRQLGFVRFNIPAAQVVRLLLLDIIVFLGSLVTLCVSISAVRLCKSADVGSGAGKGVRGVEGEAAKEETDEAKSSTLGGTSSDINELGNMLSLSNPPFPPTEQCYYQLPHAVNYILDFSVFVFLMLSGVAVPSIISYGYYLIFLVMLIIWSLHLKLKPLLRTLKVISMLYAALHLVLLDLYQFQSAQELVEFEPLNTTQSLLARIFGLTPVIQTNCFAPYELSLHSNVHYTRFLSPAFILLLLVLLSTEFRLWLFTPSLLWRMYGAFCLPVHDQNGSDRIHCLSKQGPLRRQAQWSLYGATGDNSPSAAMETAQFDSPNLEEEAPVPKRQSRKITMEMLYNKASQFVDVMWSLLLQISFILSIIAMMAWSVLYPSWPSLVLLLWTCGIWLIPKINPRNSLFYTSPLLVLYALVLLHIQYVYSLDLVSTELTREVDLGTECSRDGDIGCHTWVLLVKTLFTVVFFTSFHEFIFLLKERRHMLRDSTQDHTQDHTLDTDGRESPSEEDAKLAAARANVYKGLYRLVSTYWVLVVLGAFLLVTLAGPPTLLKTVYLAFLFLFFITYQVTEKFWFYFSFIVWWLLVLYAAVDLVLIYTYQFDVVSDAWNRLYLSSSLAEQNITASDLFGTIGLIKFEINQFQSLAVSLIPPAIFIAVLAMQLRYFSPKSPFASRIEEEASSIDLVSILPRFVRNAVQRLTEEAEEEKEGEDDNNSEQEDVTIVSMTTEEEPPTTRGSVQRQPTTSSEASSSNHQTRLTACYRFMLYAFRKTKQLLVELLNLFWRFLELHLHKVVGLTLFACSISQVSAIYWFLLCIVLLVFPLPVLNFLTYPLLTLLLGGVSISKMVYQTPLIKDSYLDFVDEEDACEAESKVSDRGLVLHSTYAPNASDAAWIGFHKATNFADYIALPIVASLFMTLWFTAKRNQASYHRSEDIKVEPYERGSLFLGVTRRQADRSIVSAVKYLINHFFEMYGVEVCWAMLAITVAVRIDIYGVLYALLLGLLLFLPHPLLAPVWLLYLFVHGLLLMAQYFFLLGAPTNICYTGVGIENRTVYPWSSLSVQGFGTPLKKWLFVPGDRVQILDKTLLYADFLVFLLAALQLHYFTRNPLNRGTPEQTNGSIVNFYKLNYWIDYFKVVVFQYSFWLSLFLMFLTATTRVSLFGLFYLLLGLIFLYRGQDMLKDRQKNRHCSWAFLRLVTWAILLLRVCLQILDCVVLGPGDNSQCVVLLLFNAVCSKNDYYGSPVVDCPAGSTSVGLWVDSLNFVVLTLQILLFDSQYSEQVRAELSKREENATFFRDIFDAKIEEQRNLSRELREREIQQLKERSAHLTETQNKVDHILYAGVHIPDELELHSIAVKPKDSANEDGDTRTELSDTLSLSFEDPQLKRPLSPVEASEMGKSEMNRTWELIKGFLFKLIDNFIDFLDSSSTIYRTVVAEIQREQSPAASDETRPLAQPIPSYGSTEPSPDPDGGQKVDVPIEVHIHPSDDQPKTEGSKKDEGAEMDGASKGGTSKSVVFDLRGDALIDELGLAPSSKDQEMIKSYEEELEEKVKHYSTRPRRFLTALYYMLLSHSDYLVFFLLILNILLNGSVLSLMYAVLMFGWGLLSVPWPTKRFWITLILYTMLVLIVKYGFQFYNLDTVYWSQNFDNTTGLYPPRIIGILHRENFFANAVWDVLLLISILFHRSLLRQYGLWRSSTRRGVSNIFMMFWQSFKKFFQRLLNPEISQVNTRDYYPIMLFFDILCFLTIVFGVGSLGVGTVQTDNNVAVAEYIRSNYVPLPFVIMLLLQFLSMLVDRAIYLRHSVMAKLIFQVLLLLAWHIWLFFLLPANFINGRPFTENAAAQCIYFFKCCYFIVSSLQIAAGYPTRILGYLFTKSFDVFTWLAFLVYRVIPLVPELREVMDWVFTDTVLSLYNWLKVQEIYAQLFLIKVQRERELEFPRSLGDKQTLLIKILLGGLLLTALVLLIWGPLLVMSVISTSGQPNQPMEVSIRLTLSGYEPLIRMTAPQRSISTFNSEEYQNFREMFRGTAVFPVFDRQYFMTDFSRVSFPGVSSTVWAISPPSRERLVMDLQATVNDPNASVSLEFYWSITRQPSTGLASETVSGNTFRLLKMATDNETIMCLLNALGATDSVCGSNDVILLRDLYPSIIHAPANEAASNFTALTDFLPPPDGSVTCRITLQENAQFINTSYQSAVEWWELKCEHNFTNFSNSSLDLYVYSERIAPPLFSAIASIGIIGLYVSVVLVIGRFFRTYISDLPTRLYIDEILNPDPLLKLCNDIFLVRENKNFQLEEILVGKLFYIFKSPDRVAKVTGKRHKIKTD